MLRIRGTMYLGRGITDTGSDVDDDEEEEAAREDDDYHYPESQLGHDYHQRVVGDSAAAGATILMVDQKGAEYPSPLLEKILSSPRSSPGPHHQAAAGSNNKMLCSGGMVEELTAKLAAEQQYRLGMAAASSSLVALTPPPSVSGESSSRATPPSTTDVCESATDLSVGALDLSRPAKSSPVILEPVSPNWKKQMLYHRQQQQQQLEASHCAQEEASAEQLDSAERIAVNALLTLCGAK